MSRRKINNGTGKTEGEFHKENRLFCWQFYRRPVISLILHRRAFAISMVFKTLSIRGNFSSGYLCFCEIIVIKRFRGIHTGLASKRTWWTVERGIFRLVKRFFLSVGSLMPFNWFRWKNNAIRRNSTRMTLHWTRIPRAFTEINNFNGTNPITRNHRHSSNAKISNFIPDADGTLQKYQQRKCGNIQMSFVGFHLSDNTNDTSDVICEAPESHELIHNGCYDVMPKLCNAFATRLIWLEAVRDDEKVRRV